jgi:hypothetical protein
MLMFVFYGYSRMKYTEVRENGFTAYMNVRLEEAITCYLFSVEDLCFSFC